MTGRRWSVVQLDDVGDLAELFGMHPTELRRFVDIASFERTATAEPLRNYRYRWLAKKSGGVRLIEAPKPVLKHLQRVVLREIVSLIPPHDAAHGFRPGRSVHSCAAPHIGRAMVIRMDLESFFASVPLGRVFRVFTEAGYADEVAHRLTGLVSNTVPGSVLRAAPVPSAGHRDAHGRAVRLLRRPHLPQGAPTSPALANLAAFGLDRRLTGLAAAFDADYTRYADDLAFSGGDELARRHGRFCELVSRIVADEGFGVNAAKTTTATASERQRVTGLVVNERVNVDRRAVDLLRAELHDAERRGPDAANRAGLDDYRAHLLGRIGWVEQANPAKAARLRRSFERIRW